MKWESIPEILAYRASETPDAPAYIQLKDYGTREEKLTYLELYNKAKNIANYLQLTTDVNDRIVLMFDNSLDFIYAYYGCLLSKRIAVPVHPPMTLESMSRLNLIIKNATPVMIFTNTEVKNGLRKLDLLRFFSRIPLISKWIRLPKSIASRIPLNLNSMDPLCVDKLKNDYEEGKPEKITGSDIAFIQYSSGSTTTPKGVIVTHKNIIVNEESVVSTFGKEIGGNGLGWLPISHDMGLIGYILYPMYRGFPYIFFTPLEFISNPIFWLKMITKYEVQTSGGPNFAYELCIKKVTEKDKEGLDLSSWKIALNGAEPIFKHTLDKFSEEFASCGFSKSTFLPCYGLAEATLFVSSTPVGNPTYISVNKRHMENNRIVVDDTLEEQEKKDLVSVGSTDVNTKIKIIDPVTLEELSENQIGEITIKNESITSGYWGVKDNSHLFFYDKEKEEKYLRTGDLGSIVNGNLYITGRIKDLIIINGKNFYPQDFEVVSGKAHPLCRTGCTAAFSVNENTQEEIIIVQEIKSKDLTKIKEIEQSIKSALSKHFQVMVRDIVLVPEYSLPKTTSGKLQRYLCKKMYLDKEFKVLNKDRKIETAKEKSEAENLDSTFEGIVKSLLKVQTVNPKEHLLSLGANSLMVAQLCMRVKDEFGVDLQIKDILECNNLEEIERKIKADLKGIAPEYKKDSIAPRQAKYNELAPMSFAQQRMWFLDNRYEGSSIYNVLGGLEIEGSIDGSLLKMAADQLILDQEILRTTFTMYDGKNYQKILDKIDGYYEEVDSSVSLKEIIAKEQNRIFDLEKGPLFHFVFAPLNGRSYLFLNIHHIITDGWSIGLLVMMLGKYYQMAAQNTLHTSKKPFLQFADYAVWQNYNESKDKLIEQEKFWLNYLKDLPAPVKLPADKPRKNEISHAGASYRFLLPTNFRSKMKDYEKRGITPFMMLFGLYALLIGRYASENDIALGVPVANRLNSSTKDMLGLFVNTIVMRVKIDDKMTFHDYLISIRKIVLEALNNQEYPFEMLVQKLKLDRTLGENPLFNSMFVFESYPDSMSQFAGINSKEHKIDSIRTMFDVTMQIMDGKNLEAVLEYSTDLFTKETMQRLSDNYNTLIQNALNNPSALLKNIKILSDEAEGELLYSFNHTEFKTLPNKSVVEIFEEQVKLKGNAVAVSLNEQSLSYARLNSLVNGLAKKIISHGVRNEEIIGVYLDRSIEMVIAILAILKAGCAYLPLNPEYPSERIDYMISDSKVNVVLTTQKTKEKAPFKAFFMDCDLELLQEDHNNLNISTPSNQLMYLIYTSGSTGRPKGALIEQKGVIRLVCDTNYYDFKSGKANCQVGNFSFDVSVFEIWGALLNGKHLVILDNQTIFSPEKLRQCFKDKEIDLIMLPTGLFHKIVMEDPDTFENLKTVFVGGETLNPHLSYSLKLRNPNLQLFNAYGPTENSVVSTVYDHPKRELLNVPIGKPLLNTSTYILDSNLHPVPIGVWGKLYTGGDGVGRGYLNGNELQNRKFIPNPFGKKYGDRLYDTGDVCRYLPDGNIEFLGRVDNQVKINGFRIELQEIESVIRESENIQNALVLVREDMPNAKQIVAYVVFKNENLSDSRIEELREKIKQKLPAFMVPHFIVELNKFPLNSNGKVDTKQMPAPKNVSQNTEETHVATETESQIIKVFSEVLKIDQTKIKPSDHFFNLGGDSLLSMQIAHRMRKQGYEITVKDIFDHPKIEDLGIFLDSIKRDIDKVAVSDLVNHEDHSSAFLQYVETLNRNGKQVGQDIEDVYPVSSMQDFTLEYRSTYPDSSSFHPQSGFEITDKDLNIPKLIQSIEEVISKEISYRTNFMKSDQGWLQMISKDKVLKVHYENYESFSSVEQEQLLQKLALNDIKKTFDVEDGALMRYYVVKLSPTKCYICNSIHHAVFDGWSSIDLLRQLFSKYKDIPYEQLEDSDAYKDFVGLERKTSLNESSKNYWIKHCDIALNNKVVPKSYSKNSRFNTAHFEIEPETLNKLATLSSDMRVTLKAVLLSAYYDALSLFKHHNENAISIVTSMRTNQLPQTMSAHGLYWKFLPLSLDLSTNKLDQLTDVQKNLNEMIEHQFFPLNSLYTHEQLEEIFYASFNFVNHYDLSNDLFNKFNIEMNLKSIVDEFSSPIQVRAYLSGATCNIYITMNKEAFAESELIAFADLYKHALLNYLYTKTIGS